MKHSDKAFWKQYIANLQVDLINAQYTKVDSEWVDIDYTPTTNKFYYIREGEGFLTVRGETFYPKPNAGCCPDFPLPCKFHLIEPVSFGGMLPKSLFLE